MIPLKEFPCRPRCSKLKQSPIAMGISLDKLFSETSNELIFRKLPTSTGNFPLNELCDKLSNSDNEGRSKTC
jgi:hypothetical protein